MAQQRSSSNTLTIVLAAGLILALIGLVVVLVLFAFGDEDGSDSDAGAIVPPPGITVVPTRVVPTPAPGTPTGVVIAPAGVNVRTGPGAGYDIILLAPLGAKGEIIGVSSDRTWWVVRIPGAPNNQGWVAAEYVRAENAGNVPVVQPPPVATPVATRTPLPTAAPDVSFTASRTTINAGETATLNWSVQNVKAVYMFPVGGSPFDYPVTGQGSRDVQPGITTSYELRVINPDDSSSSQRIEITVVAGLTSGRWVLASYSTPAGGFQNALPGTQVTARFGADGSLSGSGGCNSYNSGFTGFDRTLRIHQLTASQALCDSPPGVMDQESTFLSLMRRANSFSISAGQLEVFDASGNRILVFNNG